MQMIERDSLIDFRVNYVLKSIPPSPSIKKTPETGKLKIKKDEKKK